MSKEQIGNVVTYELNSPIIKELCRADSKLALVIQQYGNLSYSLNADPFAHTVESIVGQMLSSKAADSISARLYSLCGNDLTPSRILSLETSSLRAIGLSKLKAEYILGLSEHISENPDFFDLLSQQSDEVVIRRMTALRGIGMWSAKMYLIFVLDRLDVLPFEDGAFQQAYKWLYSTNDVRPASIKAQCAPWRPYSSIAARYMYRALDSGMTQDAILGKKFEAIT